MSDKSYNALLASWQEKIAAAPIDTISSDAGLQTELDRLYAEYPKLPKKLPDDIGQEWAAQQLSKPGFFSRLGQKIATPFNWYLRETNGKQHKTNFMDNAVLIIGGAIGVLAGGGIALSLGAGPAVIGIAALVLGGVNTLITADTLSPRVQNGDDASVFFLPTALTALALGGALYAISTLVSSICLLGDNRHHDQLRKKITDDRDFQLDCLALSSAAKRASDIHQQLGRLQINPAATAAENLEECARLLTARLIKSPNLAEMEAPNYLWQQPTLDNTQRALGNSIQASITNRHDIDQAVAELDRTIALPDVTITPTAPHPANQPRPS